MRIWQLEAAKGAWHGAVSTAQNRNVWGGRGGGGRGHKLLGDREGVRALKISDPFLVECLNRRFAEQIKQLGRCMLAQGFR